MKCCCCVVLAVLLPAQSPQEPARIQVFETIPGSVQPGEPIELRWSTTGTERVRLEPLERDFPPTGQMNFVPKERTVFWLHVSNAMGGQSVPRVVEMLPRAASARPPQARTNNAVRIRVSGSPPARRPVWIQFAALADTGSAEAIRNELSRLSGSRVRLYEIEDPDHPGRILHRLRLGPFPSVRKARARLQELRPRISSLLLDPIVAID